MLSVTGVIEWTLSVAMHGMGCSMLRYSCNSLAHQQLPAAGSSALDTDHLLKLNTETKEKVQSFIKFLHGTSSKLPATLHTSSLAMPSIRGKLKIVLKTTRKRQYNSTDIMKIGIKENSSFWRTVKRTSDRF